MHWQSDTLGNAKLIRLNLENYILDTARSVRVDLFNTDCRLNLPSVSCENDVKYANGTCYSEDGRRLGLWNATLYTQVTGRRRVSPSEEYYK